MPQTLFDKLWQEHEIKRLSDTQSLLYIDRIFLHERTGSVALQGLENAHRVVRRKAHAFCTMDHIVDTFPGRTDKTLMPSGTDFIIATRHAAHDAGITLFDINDPDQGIVHVVSPEQGIALPGSTLICPDSHTCTLGGLGALAWGVGSTEAEHALATSTLRVQRPKNMRIQFVGDKPEAVTAKDMILATIGKVGAGGGAGHAIEFSGGAISRLSAEERMTLCNMAVELSAFTGLIAPDQKVIDYVKGRNFAPKQETWANAIAHWSTLHTDKSAKFEREVEIDLSSIKPQITWGTSPEHSGDFDALIPSIKQASTPTQAQGWSRALQYMDLKSGTKLSDYPIQAAFIGSCTNSRLSDLRLAAQFLATTKNKVAQGVKAICVPGSGRVKRAAEAEGIDQIFMAAGFEWREPGCSLCFYAGGENFGEKARIASTTNRNFEGRQGLGARTHLASPLSVAASACAGYLTAVESF
jgi:3-isopropylmalate/(R)-2-methylmalate dehydratase large subunit